MGGRGCAPLVGWFWGVRGGRRGMGAVMGSVPTCRSEMIASDSVRAGGSAGGRWLWERHWLRAVASRCGSCLGR